LKTVLQKLFKQAGAIKDMHVPLDEKNVTKGYDK
jgi:hypothetical protein